MEEDDTPLLGGRQRETKHPKKDDSAKESVNLENMVLFHGKELAGKSFIRSPHYNLVRIGICKDGVYKVESTTPKILAYWKFREIRDSSYSGFSFTLQFRGGKADYSVRTDDGEAICSYIESFQKNPDKALEQARSNPPISNIPESGLMTLRRKFSGDNKTPMNNEVKFYTLNRKSNKKVEPYSKLVHNIEVDSRLRNTTPTNGHDTENRKSYSFDVRSDLQTEKTNKFGSATDVRTSSKMNGGLPHDKQLARAVLTQHIKAAGKNDKRQPGVVSPPNSVSTKGEVTTTVSTKSSSDPLQSTKRWSSNSPLQHRKLLPNHVTDFNKAGSAPPCLPPDEGEEALGTHTISKAHAMKQLNTVGKHKTSVLPPTTSDQRIPLIRKEGSVDSSSGELYSPSASEEFTFIPGGGDPPNPPTKRPISGTSSLNRSSTGSSQNYDHLDEILIKRHDSWESFSTSESGSSTAPPTTGSQQDEGNAKSKDRSPSRLSDSSNESGIYDHLPLLSPSSETKKNLADMRPTDELIVLDLPRRNISQPALSTPPSARESPSDQFDRFDRIGEESSDEETGATPTNSDEEGKEHSAESAAMGVEFEGVTLRQKKKQELANEDPFADILSPKASCRLRWSQELNPLYDYIKGFKADGVKLYDSSPVSKLLHSTVANNTEGGATNKPPSVILEDEGEHFEERESVSDDTQSVWSQDTMQSPTSLYSFGENGNTTLGEPIPKSRGRHHHHAYEDINSFAVPPPSSMPNPPSPISIMDKIKRSESATPARTPTERFRQKQTLKSATVTNLDVHGNKVGVSPRLGKRQIIQQRKSRTIVVRDDSETIKPKQRPVKVSDAFKDFSFVMREYRLFFVKMPNGYLLREVFSINKPLSGLREKLCDYLGVDNVEDYQLSMEGSCLSTMRESEAGCEVARVNRAGLNYLLDSQILPDQGPDTIVLKTNLSFRMQGISTSRILAFHLVQTEVDVSYNSDPPSEESEFHKCWISVVQGIHPLTQENAVKLAALQYQAYFLDRTAVNSVVGFSRPTEFLPVEYVNVRGVEQKMYKEQEELHKKTHREIEDAYIDHCSQLETYGAVFFPVREPRKKLLQSTKLKPVIFGVGPRGILRVDPKTKELLGFWNYNVLKNWAYSKRTFVLAFRDKSFPVESNQAKWISMLVDFFVDSLLILNATSQSKKSMSAGKQ